MIADRQVHGASNPSTSTSITRSVVFVCNNKNKKISKLLNQKQLFQEVLASTFSLKFPVARTPQSEWQQLVK